MKLAIKKNFWKNKKVFVTGHTGFKGSWLCIFLSQLGAEVTGYALKPATKPSLYNLANIKKLIKNSIIADVRNSKKLYSEIKKSKATILFHLAAQPLVRYSYENPKETFDTNFTGTLNILESIRKLNKIKSSIIITTDKVYDKDLMKIFQETDNLLGHDPYAASKVCAEHVFFSYIYSFFKNSKNQKLATVRAGNVIGGGDYSEDRLLPDIFRYIKKNKKIILRNPKSVRPWQHVLEPLSGYILLAEKLYNKKLTSLEPHWNFAPNISSCKSVKYVADFYSKKLKVQIKIAKSKTNEFKPENRFLRLSNFKARKYLNWHPRWNLNKSLKKILEWNINTKKGNHLKVCKSQIEDYLK